VCIERGPRIRTGQVATTSIRASGQAVGGGEQLYYLGVDIGGTKVSAGIVNSHGEIQSIAKGPMNTAGSAEDGLRAVKAVVDQNLSANQNRTIAGIGVSAPGLVDPAAGVIVNPVNLPSWHEYPLRSEMERTFQLPVWVDNDANAAGLAEALWGAGIGYNTVFYASIGTGIGTAIVVNQELYHGGTGAGGEGGHMIIDFQADVNCNCGKPGCIESFAAGPAIARRARVKVAGNVKKGRALLDLANGDLSALTSEAVGRGWRAGDPIATSVLVETADVLAVWFGNSIDLLDPQVIVVGGGLGELMSNFFDEIRKQLPKYSINPKAGSIPFKLARYGADSGIAGGAALCLTGTTHGLVTGNEKHQRETA
jgi:glucokinase